MFSAKFPPMNPGGRPPSIIPPMLEALSDHLNKKPSLYRNEKAVFLQGESNITIPHSRTKRVLSSTDLMKNTARKI
jgi:hypothetical protein